MKVRLAFFTEFIWLPYSLLSKRMFGNLNAMDNRFAEVRVYCSTSSIDCEPFQEAILSACLSALLSAKLLASYSNKHSKF